MDGCKPYLVAIIVRLIYTGMYVVSKAAFDSGMSTYVFVFYWQVIAVAFLVPVAILWERRRAPPVSFMMLLKMFLHAFLGITLSLDLYYAGLDYTSATVAAAVSNSVPVATFVLAVLLGMETFKLRSLSGMAKVLGLTFSIAGVMTITFYEGPQLSFLNHRSFFGLGQSHSTNNISSEGSWMKGSFLMFSSNTVFALWIVFQGQLLKEYPSKLLFTTFQCLFSTIQSFVVALLFERDFTKWKLKLDMNLVAVVYCGVVVSGFSFYLQAWCIEKKGPVFLSTWFPLSLIFTVIASSLFLDEVIHLGSVLGGVLVVGGLYSVLWGKSRENTRPKSCIETGEVCVEEKEMTSSQTV